MNLRDEVSPCANAICHTNKALVFENQWSKWPLHYQILWSKMYSVLSNYDLRWKLFCKIPARFLINFLRMLLYSEYSHKDMLYRLAITLTKKKKQASLLFLVLCLNSSSFRPWVPDLNLKKKNWTHVRDSILLALKIFFQLSIYSQYTLLTH